MREPRVLVLGATGQLGGRLMRLLGESLEPARLCGASRGRIERADHITLDVHRPPADELIQAGDVIIDAVGPYRHEPSPWLTRCAQRGAHWIDLSESPTTHARVRAVQDRFTRSSALTGCSTVPALASLLLAALMRDATRATKSAHIFLSMGSDNPASAGLLYSLLRPLGRAMPEQQRERGWSERIRRELTSGHARVYGAYPCPPLGLGVPTRFWSGFDRAALWYPLRVAAMVTPQLSDSALMRVSELAAPVARLWRPLGTTRGSLRLECLDERGALIAGLEVHAPRDGLDIPALPAVWASLALLGSARVVETLAELISAREALRDLTRRSYESVKL